MISCTTPESTRRLPVGRLPDLRGDAPGAHRGTEDTAGRVVAYSAKTHVELDGSGAQIERLGDATLEVAEVGLRQSPVHEQREGGWIGRPCVA